MINSRSEVGYCGNDMADDEVGTDQEEGSCQQPSCNRHCRATVLLGGAGELSSTRGASGMQHFAWYCPHLTLQIDKQVCGQLHTTLALTLFVEHRYFSTKLHMYDRPQDR